MKAIEVIRQGASTRLAEEEAGVTTKEAVLELAILELDRRLAAVEERLAQDGSAKREPG